MEIPPDRTGGELTVHLDGRDLTSGDLLGELPGFAFDEATAHLFPGPTYADWTFPRIDAAHLGVTFWDFGRAIADGRPAEVDGRAGTTAVAAILGAYEAGVLGRAVTLDEMLAGDTADTQVDIDIALGLRDRAGAPIATFGGATVTDRRPEVVLASNRESMADDVTEPQLERLRRFADFRYGEFDRPTS